jgi:chromosome segregation ATPase
MKEIDTLTTELAEEATQYENDKKALSEELHNTKQKLKEAQAGSASTSNEIHSANRDLREARQEVEKLKGTVEQLRDDAEANTNKYKEEQEKNLKQLQATKQQLDDACQELDTLKCTTKEGETKSASIRQDLRTAQHDLEEARQKLKQLEDTNMVSSESYS